MSSIRTTDTKIAKFMYLLGPFILYDFLILTALQAIHDALGSIFSKLGIHCLLIIGFFLWDHLVWIVESWPHFLNLEWV